MIQFLSNFSISGMGPDLVLGWEQVFALVTSWPTWTLTPLCLVNVVVTLFSPFSLPQGDSENKNPGTSRKVRRPTTGGSTKVKCKQCGESLDPKKNSCADANPIFTALECPKCGAVTVDSA